MSESTSLPTSLLAVVWGWLCRPLADRLTHDFEVAQANGWVVTRGGFGSITVRDPRFDLIHECGHCHGTGRAATETGCVHGPVVCDRCWRCPSCAGRGTVRRPPLVNLPAPEHPSELQTTEGGWRGRR